MRWHGLAVRQDDGVLFAVPNGGKREPLEAARLTGISAEQRAMLPQHRKLIPYGLGVLPGVPDLILTLPGTRLVFIELKAPLVTHPPVNVPSIGPRTVLQRAGKLSEQQLLFREVVAAMGHPHRVLRWLTEYPDLLEEFGVPYHASRPFGPGVSPPGRLMDRRGDPKAAPADGG